MEKSEFYREARRDLPGPLAGIRVLEATTTWAGPLCACILADLGAEVVKVEVEGGEVNRRVPPFLPHTEATISPWHATINRNKRCITLDLRLDQSREAFLRLAESCDMIVENFRPDTLARWGLGYADVKAVKPDIVYVSISGWGQFGPHSERVGYDPLAQAASGFLSLNGEVEGAPVRAATTLADDLAGLHGAIGALAALAHRTRTGEGQHVDVALLDSMVFHSNGNLTLGALGVPIPRMGNEYIIAAPANVYRCRDGSVYISALLDSHWRRLACIIGHPELSDHPDYATVVARISQREQVNRHIAAWVAPRSVGEVVEHLAKEGLPAAPVRTYEEAARDPHLAARDMLQTTRLEDGSEAPITGPVAKFSRTPTRIRSGAPAPGAHTDEVLGEIGHTERGRRPPGNPGVR